MTGTGLAADPARVGGRSGRLWRLVAVLSVTQTIGYGVLYYCFAVFLVPVAAELRAGTTAVTGALTLAVLVSAAAAVPVGRWLDRHGGRGLMTLGGLVGVAAVLAWSRAESLLALYAAFTAIGLASAMVLYESAFAVVVAVVEPVRRAWALLTITVVAGFASSVFLPAAGLLNTRFGWRTSLVVLAVVLAATVPLHRWAVPPGTPPAARRSRSAPRAVRRERRFWLLAVAFTAHGGALAVIAVLLVTYLISLGHTATFAASVAGLLGALSVTGRILTTALRRRAHTATVTAAIYLLQAAAAGALPFIGHTRIGAATCVIGFGLGFGVSTLARPALLTEYYGTRGYATLAGTVALPATLAKAVAPLAATALAAAAGGYAVVIAAVAAACAVAAVLLFASRTAIPETQVPATLGA